MLGGLPGSQTCLAATAYRKKSSARGAASRWSTARCPPGTPRLAPRPHARQTGCPASTQQCSRCQGSHNTVDGLYHAFCQLLFCAISFPSSCICCPNYTFCSPFPSVLLLNSFSGLGRVTQAHFHGRIILQLSHILSE